MRALLVASWAAVGVYLTTVAADAAAGYSFWRSVGDHGLGIAMAVASFLGMGFALRSWDKDRREKAKATDSELESMREFTQGKLLETTVRSVACMDRAHETNERLTAAVEKLVVVIELMRVRLYYRPCMAMEFLTDKDRHTVLQIFRRHAPDREVSEALQQQEGDCGQ